VRHLLAWVSSFTRKEQIVNRATAQLAEIARERVHSSAGTQVAAQAQGYQRARLRQSVREYLGSCAPELGRLSPAAQKQLVERVLDRLVEQDLIPAEAAPPPATLPRKAA